MLALVREHLAITKGPRQWPIRITAEPDLADGCFELREAFETPGRSAASVPSDRSLMQRDFLFVHQSPH